MKNLFALTAICALLSAPAMAQTQPQAAAEPPADINAAVKTITELTNDQTKVAGYCAITKEMAGVAETDTAKMEAVGTKMDAYLTGLGEQYAEAFEAGEGVTPESEDGKKLEAAYTALKAKCGAS